MIFNPAGNAFRAASAVRPLHVATTMRPKVIAAARFATASKTASVLTEPGMEKYRQETSEKSEYAVILNL
jgi:hypothetical protein